MSQLFLNRGVIVDGFDREDRKRVDSLAPKLRDLLQGAPIVINKSDLVDAAELDRVKERIQAINGLAKVHVTMQSTVPQLEGFLLDLHAYDEFNEAEAKVKGHSHLDPVRSMRWLLGSYETKRADTRTDNIHGDYPCRTATT